MQENTTQERAKSMVLASFVADSFALGTHWIYDTARIEKQFGRVSTLLPPHEGTYHPSKKLGDFTHYGDQALHLLEYLADHGGHFDTPEYAQDWHSFITRYQGYMDHASKETLKNLDAHKGYDACGSRSTDLGGPARIAPLIYCYRDDLDELLRAVRAQTSLTHSGPGVVEGARFLAGSCYAILHGATPRDAIEDSLKYMEDNPELHLRLGKCLEPSSLEPNQQIKEFGQMCAIRAALPGAVYTVLQNEDNLEKALIETVMAGGDSAARGMAVGMLLGASQGTDKIPSRWLEKLTGYDRIMAALDRLP